MIRTRLAGVVLCCMVLASPAPAYGPRGHALVGAIADQRLGAKPIAAKISDLLDGMSLAEAALIPDQIKDWDKNGPDDPNTFHLHDHPAIETQLIEFWRANPPTARDPKQPPPNHHWFHYTDVSVKGDDKYVLGKTGTSRWDVVQMIPYCVKVLQGREPDQNDRKITKPVALILLAHYIGDIHQPLHVGAAYFDQDKQLVDPDHARGQPFGANGGNDLTLVLEGLSSHGHSDHQGNLHHFWDEDAVAAALETHSVRTRARRGPHSGRVTDGDIARQMAGQEPEKWQLPAGLSTDQWSVAWADEILPIAKEAHDRLEFRAIHLDTEKHLARGLAAEKSNASPRYRDWAGKIVHDELHKAGWRLAAIVEEAMKSAGQPDDR